MKNRIIIYFSIAALILIGAHLKAQQVDVPIDMCFSIGVPFSLVVTDTPAEFGILPALNGEYLDEELGEFGRMLDVSAGYGTAIMQFQTSAEIIDLSGHNPSQPTPDFQIRILDDPTNTPPDLFVFTHNASLSAGVPLQTGTFTDTQKATWSMHYKNVDFDLKGDWVANLTVSVIAQ